MDYVLQGGLSYLLQHPEQSRKILGPYLLSISGAVPDPLPQLRSPVLQHVRLRILRTLAVPEPPLRPRPRDHVHIVEVYLQPLRRFRRYLGLRTPRTALNFLVQSVNFYILVISRFPITLLTFF